jgi:hypothetical protein
LTSCFPGMLLMYFLNDLKIVPVPPISKSYIIIIIIVDFITVVKIVKYRTLQCGGNSDRFESKRNLYNNVMKTLTGKELHLWKTGDQEYVGGFVSSS